MIEDYGFGKIVINGKTYKNDLIIFEDHVEQQWWREKGHELNVNDIKEVVEKYEPVVIVVGTGKFGMMKVLPETKTYFESLDIQLNSHKTQKACDVFNNLSKKQKTLGAFHLTC